MTKPTEAASPVSNVRDRIIVALDVEKADEAREIARQLRGRVGAFKIGLQLFTAAGPGFVREMTESGARIFLDLKFHDIPNTVAKASVEAARFGVWMFNIHTLGGVEMMKRTVSEVREVCEREKIERPLIIGVTVLTSSNAGTLTEVGIANDVEKQVVLLARLAVGCGLDGVVASPHEARTVRKEIANSDFLLVTPGIRPNLATLDDQKRVTTLGQALAHGSDYVVIGRPITTAKDRIEAVERIVAEV